MLFSIQIKDLSPFFSIDSGKKDDDDDDDDDDVDDDILVTC